MSKGDGLKIGIKFTEDLIGDVSGLTNGFSIKGKQFQYVTGPLIDGDYRIESVERYPLKKVWIGDFSIGSFTNTRTIGEALKLKVQETKLIAMEDSFAGQTSPTAVNGGLDYLNVLGSNGYYTRSYLRFDTPDSDIVKAELFLYCFANDIPSREQRHYIKRLTQRFDEETLSYNNSPSFYGEGSLSSGAYGRLQNVDGHNTGINKWRSADITGLVQEWMQSIYPNYGLVLDHNYNSSYDGGIWASIKYRSKEYVDPNYHPYIKVQYATPVTGSIIGNWTSPAIQSSEQCRVRWHESKPPNTDIIIEYTTGETQGQWQQVSDGEEIAIDTNLWIRVTLSTDDTAVSPILQDLWLEELAAPKNKIVITTQQLSRFNNVEGELAVEYDSTKGVLAGVGGPVESFTKSFLPQDLIKLPNPYIPERFTVAPNANIQFTRAVYNNRYTSDRFSVTATCAINFEFVGIINP